MPNPNNQGDRAKAYRLRKSRTLAPVDKLWLAEYDEEKAKADSKRRPFASGDAGASRSRSKRTLKVDLQEEDAAEAVGTGSAAIAAASAALAAKEEGRRLDSLTINAVDALKEAVEVYKAICLSLMQRTEVLEGTHIAMLDSVRAHFLARSEAEAELLQAQSGDAGIAGALVQQLVGRMGKSTKAEKVNQAKAQP